MKLTIPHYHDFSEDRDVAGDELSTPEAWDALRLKTRGPFALPTNRDDWERTADARRDAEQRARLVDAWLRAREAKRLASYGVGTALLELWLHRLAPERSLTLTENSPQTLERLSGLFGDASVVYHDLSSEPPLEADVHLFYRIDTEFDDATFRGVFRRFADQTVMLVPTQVLGPRKLLAELRTRYLRRHSTRAGCARTRAAFEALWAETHTSSRLRLNDTLAWVLEHRGA